MVAVVGGFLGEMVLEPGVRVATEARPEPG